MKRYIIECRVDSKDPWSPLTDATFSQEEVEEFRKILDEGDDLQYQVVSVLADGVSFGMIQKFRIYPDRPALKEEADPPLSRHMPKAVHELNDRILTSLGL